MPTKLITLKAQEGDTVWFLLDGQITRGVVDHIHLCLRDKNPEETPEGELPPLSFSDELTGDISYTIVIDHPRTTEAREKGYEVRNIERIENHIYLTPGDLVEELKNQFFKAYGTTV